MHIILFLVGLAAACSAFAGGVLVTAFEPFGGAKENGSRLVAQALEQRRDQLLAAGIDLRVCILPVEYAGGAEAAKSCYRSLRVRPELVLSMGEYGCRLHLESRFHNLDHAPDFPDNAGVIRENAPIDPSGPAELPATLPLADMHCVSGGSVEVVASNDAGNYVCNGTGYRLQRFFSGERIPFGFIHVPNSGCGGKPAEAAEQVERMLRAAWAAMGGVSRDPGWEPILGRMGASSQPASLAEVRQRLQIAAGAGASACVRDYYAELMQQYSFDSSMQARRLLFPRR